jgi:arsenite/tail-anchored protein-transporting ATPase
VLNPERVVVAETQRTATSLSLFGYAVDAIIANRVLPDEVTDPYLARWKQRQAEHLANVGDLFAPTPVLTAPLFDDELEGIAGLGALADAVYGDLDEVGVLGDRRPVTVETDGGRPRPARGAALRRTRRGGPAPPRGGAAPRRGGRPADHRPPRRPASP